MIIVYKIIMIIGIFTIQKINKSYLINLKKLYSLKQIRKYMDKCLHGIYFNKKFINHFENPKISIIIPVFNCEDSIKLSIISIKNQKLKEFELLLINDGSKDNSKKIIENFKKNDSRIIIINNIKNRGTLYSRNIGVLVSKGKYIFPLDNDDMFLDENLFHYIYKDANKNHYDIIGFKTIIGYTYNSNINDLHDDPFIKNKKNNVIYKPQLNLYSLKNNDCHIWGKSIKNELYKNAVNKLGKARNSIYLCYSEDDIMIFLIFKYSKSFKFINKYGLFHLKSNKTASFYLSRNHIIFSKIFFLDFLFDFTENNIKEKKYVISNAIKFHNKFFSVIPLNKENKKYLNIIIQKILKSNFISKEDKNNIKLNFMNIF